MPISESSKVAARNIREQLKVRKMTQGDLANLIGCSQPRVGELLKPKKDLRLGTLERIALVFHMPPAALITPPQADTQATS